MILHIDPSDEINTIIHRIENCHASSIVLVVPEDYERLHDRINLQLLIKYAKDYNKELSLQSNDPILHSLAQQYDVEVWQDNSVATKDSADQDEQPSSTNSTSHQSSGSRKKGQWRNRLVVLLLIIGAFLGLIYMNVPQALVVITPEVRSFTERVVFDFIQINAVESIGVNVSLTRRTPTTGRKTVGISKAEGVVVLVNQGTTDVFVPRGTVVKTAGDVAFVTIMDVEIPSRETEYFMDVPFGIRAGRGEVGIIALNPGSRFNVSAGRIHTILGYDLDVRNPEATTGGEDTILPVAADSDIQRGKDAVIRDARQITLEALQTKIGTGRVLEDTLSIHVDWKDMTNVGEETEEVFVSANSHGEMYVLDPERLAVYATQALTTIIPKGFYLLPASLDLQNIRVAESEQGWQLILTVTGQAQGDVDLERVTANLLGASLTDVMQVTNNNPEIAQIQVEGSSREQLPRYQRWIHVEVIDPVI